VPRIHGFEHSWKEKTAEPEPEKGKFNRSFKLFAARRASHDGCDPRLRLQPPYGKDRPRPAHPAAVDSRDRFLDFAVSLL
jgi:hypothetical protein